MAKGAMRWALGNVKQTLTSQYFSDIKDGENKGAAKNHSDGTYLAEILLVRTSTKWCFFFFNPVNQEETHTHTLITFTLRKINLDSHLEATESFLSLSLAPD